MSRKWGLVGALVNHQWDVAGSNDASFSTTSGQYFYAYGLGKGWQVSSGPSASYNWKGASGEIWTVPLGVDVSKTTKLGGSPWKFAMQLHYHVAQPEASGPVWLFKFTVTPVVKKTLASLFK